MSPVNILRGKVAKLYLQATLAEHGQSPWHAKGKNFSRSTQPETSKGRDIVTASDSPRRLWIPRSRALTIDVLHYHRKTPTCAHERMCDLARVEALRQQLPERIAWPILFIKAFALAAENYPRLRQTWCSWPWPHLFQHTQNVGMLATHREFRGEPWLFWSRFSNPEARPLPLLQRDLDRYQTKPVETVFQRQLLFSALPVVLRRLIWWWNLNIAGAKRARRIGTFFLTTLAGRGAEIQHPPAFLTANLTYGPLDERGLCRVTLAYDHRLMDGRMVADVLADLDAALNGPIADELQQLIAAGNAPTNIAAGAQPHAA